MRPVPGSDPRHRRALRQAAMWLHPIATSLKTTNPTRAAALRAAARLCETAPRGTTCRAAKDAMLAIPAPQDMDQDAWTSGLVGGLTGVNLHAARLGVDPYRDVAEGAETGRP